jgi:signal transduction histidine kinase
MFAKHEMAYVANGFTAKPEILINNICFQGLCYMVYYFVTLPKLKAMEADKKFADYGKTSSFLMHEMAKPLRKMNQDPECFQEELNRLNEIYSIASSLRNKEDPLLVLEEVNINKFINDILSKYETFIKAYDIKMSIQTDVNIILTDKKLIRFSLDNLIKNAIEANVDFEGDRFIEFKILKNKILIKNPFFDTSFSESNLFKPMSSTKKGHMGVGLYISKMISDTLGHKLHINTSKNFFEVLISLS